MSTSKAARMCMTSWHAYRRTCWGADEVFRSQCVDWLKMGLTIVDGLDMLWLLGEKGEFARAVEWVSSSLQPENALRNVFEATIRVLGGLLSGYALSADVRLLRAAEAVGHRMLSHWRPHAMPDNRRGSWANQYFSLAEVGTLQLEFRYLWHVTNRTDIKRLVATRACVGFERLTSRVLSVGLLSATVNDRGKSVSSDFHVGGGADSFYEYMLKTHLQDGKRYPCAYARFKVARDAIRARLIRRWDKRVSFLVRVDRTGRVYSRSMEHLECFVPGMLALDYRTSGDAAVLEDARRLMAGCWQLYNLSATTGVEGVHFGRTELRISNFANVLRPEVAESLYYLWKVTKDVLYRQWGDRMLASFERHSRFGNKYCTMRDVRRPSCDGKMESFWIAETLKYLHLLRHDTVDLDKWVFNTEAHPLPVVPDLPPCSCRA